MDLLLDVLNMFNEPDFFVGLHVNMGRFDLCGCKGESYINDTQWLKPQAYLKWDVGNRAMKSSVGHKKGCHPTCVDVWSCTSARCAWPYY